MSDQRRHDKGTPAGGRFAPSQRAEADQVTRCEVAQAPSFRAGLATSPRPQIGSRAIRTSRARTLRHPRVR